MLSFVCLSVVMLACSFYISGVTLFKILAKTSFHIDKSEEILKSEELGDLQYKVLFYLLTYYKSFFFFLLLLL